jgi:hypothetical protein
MLACAGDIDSRGDRSVDVYEMRSERIKLNYSVSNIDEYVGWLDADRVIFEGYAQTPSNKATDTGVGGVRALFIWNLRTGQVDRHTKFALRSVMCLANGFISYFVERNGALIHMEGTVGNERETSSSPGLAFKGTELNPFTCHRYERTNVPPARFGGGVRPLAFGDGWIEFVEGGSWLYAEGGEPKKLELATLGPRSVFPHKYSSFARKYLFFYVHGTARETWAFGADGSLEQLRFPEGEWGDGSVEPVLNGLLLRSRSINVRADWDVGKAGLYFHSTKTGTRRLIVGVIYALSVNPDGCQVAAFVDPWNGRGRKSRLVAIDLCKVN